MNDYQIRQIHPDEYGILRKLDCDAFPTNHINKGAFYKVLLIHAVSRLNLIYRRVGQLAVNPFRLH